MPRYAWVGLVSCLFFGVACRPSPSAAIPSVREVDALDVPALAERFAAVAARLRSDDRGVLERGASTERARRAGHVALIAYRKHHDARFARFARRWLVPASRDVDAPTPACLASVDLAELHVALGDSRRAADVVRATLASGIGSFGCRTSLRALGSSLGVESESTSFGTDGVHANIVTVDVIGADRADAASVRVVVSLDGAARGELIPPSEDARGERLARLRFADTRLAPSLALPRSVDVAGLLRIDGVQGDATGLDFVLREDAVVRAYALESPVRWVVDFDRPTQEAPIAVGPPRLVILDPGHGGDEHGARVDGTRESHLVLDIAQRAAARLRQLLPMTRVVLTRTSDDEVSLEQRSAMANALGADLFVSIHLNDADVPVVTGGITTFVLDTDNERQAVRLAARENSTTTDRVGGLSVLLAGLHRTTQVGESRRLASLVHAATLAHARTVLPRIPDRGVRSELFYVLVGTRMPAVLVECSFMTRPEELTALRTAPYREELGRGIAEGIAQYAESR